MVDSTPERRRAWRAYSIEYFAITDRWLAQGSPHPRPPVPACPVELRGLTCGAKTRSGWPCKRSDIYTNGRCKYHGGLSSGPRTAEGKARAAMNGLIPKRTP